MEYTKQLSQKAKSQRKQIPGLVNKALKDNEKWIRETIRNRWKLGKRPDGQLIGWYQSESYANEKYSQNSLAGFGNVDLVLTGALWKGIQVKPFSDTKTEIFSTDSKYEDISEAFGDWNFNLSEEEREYLYNELVCNKVLLDSMNDIYE